MFGEVTALDRFRGRWNGLVSVEDGVGAGLDAARAGVRDGGAVLVRPDGFIGFRAVPADTAGMDALDAHLASYLVPVRGGRDGTDDLGGTAGVAVQLPPGR